MTSTSVSLAGAGGRELYPISDTQGWDVWGDCLVRALAGHRAGVKGTAGPSGGSSEKEGFSMWVAEDAGHLTQEQMHYDLASAF